jgi:hypothetical protein
MLMHKLTYRLNVVLFVGWVLNLLWAQQIAFWKHVYHVWCAHAHFSLSFKCIDILCGEDMHERWWVATDIKKPKNELSFPQFQQTPKISNWQGMHIFLT